MDALIYLLVILGIVHTIRIFLVGKKSQQQNPALDYLSQSEPKPESWRWRTPPVSLGVQIKDAQSNSQIEFSPNFNFTDYSLAIISAASLFCAALALLFGIFLSLFGGTEGGSGAFAGFFLSLIAGIFGAVSLSVRQRVVSIHRTPQHLIVQYLCGVWWKRKRQFFPNDNVGIDVKAQRVTDYDSSQSAPFYELTMTKKGRLLSSQTKLYLCANQSQSTWVKGGMGEWFEQARRSPTANHPSESSQHSPSSH